MKLSHLEKGKSAKIVRIGECKNRIRLMEMGLCPQTEIALVRIAPLKGPLEIFLRGYFLTLRREDAEKIEITLI